MQVRSQLISFAQFKLDCHENFLAWVVGHLGDYDTTVKFSFAFYFPFSSKELYSIN